MNKLDGKVVIFTGAGSGLGFAYAQAAARAGARVVINDIDQAAAESALASIVGEGGEATSYVGSVSSWADSRALVNTAFDRYGALDGIVLNAAVMHMAEPWLEREASLRAIAEVNVLGVQFSGAHAMKAMAEGGRGGVVLTVVSGAMLGIKGMSAYGATKGAVASMTYNWAIEGMSHSIRVNAVSPAALTKMSAEHMDQAGNHAVTFAAPEAIAPLVVALLSDDLQHLSGRIIRFDGTILSEYVQDTTVHGERAEWTTDDLVHSLHGLAGGLREPSALVRRSPR
jgi:NAD(P)-dependent dehydrogenase (short-subunit alcohol dehydrogenase family)